MRANTYRPRTTMFAGGLGLILAAITSLPFGLEVPFRVLHIASALVLLAATCILAFGVQREHGIAGASAIGKIALISFGARNIVTLIIGGIPFGPESTSTAIVLNTTLSILFAVAGLIAAIFVLRARVLRGPARWVLLAVAIIYAILTALTLFSVIEIAQFLSDVHAEIVLPVLFLILGVVYLAQSRDSRS